MRRADNLTTFMCRLSLKSGSLNLLEHSGPVQVCNGVALLQYLVELPNVKFHKNPFGVVLKL